MKLNLGRLAHLLDEIATEVAIKPILETRSGFGGVTNPGPFNVVAAWEIQFSTTSDSFTYRGDSVASAVEAAYADESSWR